MYGNAAIWETEMGAFRRFFRDQSDAPAIACCLIAAIALIAVISGIHFFVPA
jgi:Flp pilus assembly pilin Flp